MYLIYQSYYKHGETNVTLCESDEACKNYLIEHLIDTHVEDELEIPEYEIQYHLAGLSLERLIDMSIDYSEKILRDQIGYFVVHIARIEGTIVNYGYVSRYE